MSKYEQSKPNNFFRVSLIKDQLMSLFKTKDYIKPKCVKTVYGRGKKKSEENIIKSIRNLFKLKRKKMKQLKTE